MLTPIVIQEIKKKHNITDYLKERGHDPVRTDALRSSYNCPIHGPEKDPSFYTFKHNDGYDYFYCFGCLAKGDIVNLVSKLEHISFGESIKKLSQGIKIGEGEITREMENNVEYAQKEIVPDIEQTMIRLAFLFNDFMEYVNYDSIELALMEKAYQKIDIMARAFDSDSLSKIAEFMIESAIPNRIENFMNRKAEIEKIKYIKGNING